MIWETGIYDNAGFSVHISKLLFFFSVVKRICHYFLMLRNTPKRIWKKNAINLFILYRDRKWGNSKRKLEKLEINEKKKKKKKEQKKCIFNKFRRKSFKLTDDLKFEKKKKKLPSGRCNIFSEGKMATFKLFSAFYSLVDKECDSWIHGRFWWYFPQIITNNFSKVMLSICFYISFNINRKRNKTVKSSKFSATKDYFTQSHHHHLCILTSDVYEDIVFVSESLWK